MIVADTSAFAAIIFREAEADSFIDVIERTSRVWVAAPTAFELQLVMLRKKGPSAVRAAQKLLVVPSIEIVPWERLHIALAVQALARFGGRPARLNFGDCIAYALAKSSDVPLLYKGQDFGNTDIRSAL